MPLHRSRPSTREENYVYGDEHKYASDMEKLFLDEKLCDTRFLVGRNALVMYGHKAIIASRCPLLTPKLLPGAPETMQATKSSHMLRDVEPDIFRRILLFLYSNCIRFDDLTITDQLAIFHASLLFQLSELTKLVTTHLIEQIDGTTVFEILNAAVKLKQAELQHAAMEHMVAYSSEILAPGNTDLYKLTPGSMLTILKSDDLMVDEFTLFHAAIEWADVLLTSGYDFATGISPGSPSYSRATSPVSKSSRSASGKRESISQERHSMSLATPYRPNQRLLRAVSSVLGAIRYALLSPEQLTKIESNRRWMELIPPSCLTDAWRIITFKQTGSHPDESLTLPNVPPKQRGVSSSKKQVAS